MAKIMPFNGNQRIMPEQASAFTKKGSDRHPRMEISYDLPRNLPSGRKSFAFLVIFDALVRSGAQKRA
jgi:hypothetical protein